MGVLSLEINLTSNSLRGKIFWFKTGTIKTLKITGAEGTPVKGGNRTSQKVTRNDLSWNYQMMTSHI